MYEYLKMILLNRRTSLEIHRCLFLEYLPLTNLFLNDNSLCIKSLSPLDKNNLGYLANIGPNQQPIIIISQ